MGCGAAVAWRFVRPGLLRTTLQVTGSLLVLVPQLLIIFLLYQSIVLLLYQEALLSLWMVGVAVLAAWHLGERWKGEGQMPSRWQRLSRRKETPKEVAFQAGVQHALRARQRRQNPVVLGIIALVMGGFGLYLGKVFLADAFYPRAVVEGRVENLRYRPGGRAPRLSEIIISGQTFRATGDLHHQLRPGEYIRAEIGAGSHAILRWQRR
jgi:hypothetical protein